VTATSSRGEKGGKLPGLIVAFEGIDGSGLGTHSRGLLRYLQERLGLAARRDKEPSRGPVGDLIWQAMTGLYPSLAWNPVLALLFAADRLHHLYRKAAGTPAAQGGLLHLASQGHWVVLDRYKYSSLVYQSMAAPGSLGRVPEDWVALVNQYAPPPHILVYLDVDPGVAAERIVETRKEVQLYEQLDALRRVKEAYDRLAARLAAEPEYCPGSGSAPWEDLMRGAGLEPRSLYPQGACYPAVVVARETPGGRERPVEEVQEDIRAAVVAAAARLGHQGLDREVVEWAEGRLREAEARGRIELRLHRKP